MAPESSSGFRLSQEQVRFVELAIKEAILEEVEDRLSAVEAGREDEITQRLAEVDRLVTRHSGQARGSLPVPVLGGLGAGLLVLCVALIWFLVPTRVGTALTSQSDELAAMAQVAGGISANASKADSLAELIQERADELELGAASEALRADIAERLKRDGEFIRLAQGPAGPQGPTGEAPNGVRYGTGVAFFESGGQARASVGLSAQGSGHAQVHNRSGARVGYMGATSNGDGLLLLSDRRDRSSVNINTGRDSSSVTLHNGSAVAYLGTPSDGTAQLTVANRSGDGGVTLRSRGGLGAILVNGRTVHDLAEVFELGDRTGVEPGTVLSAINDEGGLGLSLGAYDRRVVGVVSGAGGYIPGMILGSRDDGSADLPVAINGQVFVKVSLAGGPIRPGDLLVASNLPGVAMRGSDEARLTGAVIGKALETHGAGDADGLVKMLVMPR